MCKKQKFIRAINVNLQDYIDVVDMTYDAVTEGAFKKEIRKWEPNYIKYIAQTAIRIWELEKMKDDLTSEFA